MTRWILAVTLACSTALAQNAPLGPELSDETIQAQMDHVQNDLLKGLELKSENSDWCTFMQQRDFALNPGKPHHPQMLQYTTSLSAQALVEQLAQSTPYKDFRKNAEVLQVTVDGKTKNVALIYQKHLEPLYYFDAKKHSQLSKVALVAYLMDKEKDYTRPAAETRTTLCILVTAL